MTGERTRYALLGLAVLGLAVAVWSIQLHPWELALTFTILGIGLAFGASALAERVSGRSYGFPGLGRVDERSRVIEARAARNAWFVVLGLLSIVMFSSQYRPWEPSGSEVAILVSVVGIATMISSGWLYESQM